MRFCALFLIILVHVEQWKYMLVSCKIINIEICGPETIINLEPAGEASSVTILLNPMDHKRSCKLNITAPNSHVVNLQWREDHRELLENHASHSSPYSPCPLSVFLPEDKRKAVWKGDPCAKDSLAEVDLLTPQLSLYWTPPRFQSYARGRKLVVTAVGQGDICKTEGQHTCMRIGWEPVLCVSEQLVCDGNPNCPKGSSTSDEDEVLCKSHLLIHPSWQQLAEDVIRKFPPELMNTDWLKNKKDGDAATDTPPFPPLKNWKDVKKYEVTTSQPDSPHHHDGGDSVSAALAHYGPWGYLMLGMLICGTVLMFCGLWECFRKPKPQIDLQTQQQPTTVLIINRPQDDMVSHLPPNYDDLDQPPSYLTLFPNFKVVAVEGDVVTDEQVGVEGATADESVSNTSGDSGEDHSDTNSVDNEVARHSVCDGASNGEVEVNRERRSPTVCIVTNL